MAAIIYKIEIDQTDLCETLALVQQIEAAALRAQAALASCGVMQSKNIVVVGSLVDEVRQLHIAAVAIGDDVKKIARNFMRMDLEPLLTR